MTIPANGFHFDVHAQSPEAAVSQLIEHAVEVRASDLLFASNDHHYSVSIKHLGVQRLVTVLTQELGRSCVGHIKAMAGINFVEHRRPLDGHWRRSIPSGQRIDLRVSILPTLHGEDVNLRFLCRQAHFLGLDRLGMLTPVEAQVREILENPSGLVLIAGPTGSGKTTTQYALLNYLNNGQRKINTIEEPIEYELTGIRQAEVDPQVSLGFPELLRAVLRQAPDVIMLGEIRDPEVADTAVRAANSGHLVLATLHAPGASAAILSLKALGVSPHFLGMSIRAVLSQRLVRTVCPHCRTVAEDSSMLDEFKETFQKCGVQSEMQMYEASACAECRYTGYVGQTGIFELMALNERLRHHIYDGKRPGDVYRQSLSDGMIPFRTSAFAKIAEGVTSLTEVKRILSREFLEN